MGVLTIVAIVLAVAFILVPVVFVWYLNFSGMRVARRVRKATLVRQPVK